MQKILLTITLMVAVSGCAGHGHELNDTITSWKGSHVDVARKEWGCPTKEKTILGHKIYMWDLEGKANISRSWTKWDGPSVERKYCNCILEVDDKNIITDGHLEGNNCP